MLLFVQILIPFLWSPFLSHFPFPGFSSYPEKCYYLQPKSVFLNLSTLVQLLQYRYSKCTIFAGLNYVLNNLHCDTPNFISLGHANRLRNGYYTHNHTKRHINFLQVTCICTIIQPSCYRDSLLMLLVPALRIAVSCSFQKS